MGSSDTVAIPRIGSTPLVPLPGLTRRGSVTLKAEYTNAFGSVKDRAALYLMKWAHEVAGPSVCVVESTSGNLGCALAHLAEASGSTALMVMDASLAPERIQHVRDAGAEVHFVAQPRPGLNLRQTRIAIAEELGARAGHLWLDQYGNDAGLAAHHDTTAPEIWQATNGQVDAVVASVGTGGTICGIGEFFRDVPQRPVIVGVEPVGSTIFGGVDAPYLAAGSGMRGPSDLVVRHGSVIDRFAKVPDPIAAWCALDLSRRFGLRLGMTAAAAVAVGSRIAEQDDARTVVIAPDLVCGFDDEIAQLAMRAEPGWPPRVRIVDYVHAPLVAFPKAGR